MNEILKDIQLKVRAGKDHRNDFGGFNYRNVERMLSELKPILAEHDSYITFNDAVKECGGRCYIEATATIHTPQGDESASAVAREQDTKKGMDAAQISGSCSTYARKYALCGLLAVDDNSRDPDSQKPVEMITKGQVKIIVKLAESKGSDLSDICDYFKVNTLDEMTAEEYANCIKMLQKKGEPNG